MTNWSRQAIPRRRRWAYIPPGAVEWNRASRKPGAVMHRSSNLRGMGTVRAFALVVVCAAFGAASPARAAMPVLSSPAQVYVVHAQPLLAIIHVRVIDGHGTPARENQTVLLRDGRIAAVGRHVTLPEGATVIDGGGQTLIPGLVGMHDHMFYPAPKVNPAAKEAIYPGRIPGPKMHTTGPYLEGKGSFTPQMHELADAADARDTVNYWMDEGATSFKAYMHITRAELSAAIAAAHARGIKVTGHLCSIGFTEAADLGIDDLEHGLFVDTEFTAGKQPDVCPDTKAAVAHMATLKVDGPEIRGLIRHLLAKH